MVKIFQIFITIGILNSYLVRCQNDDQPRILYENNSLVIESALDRNISVHYNGRSAIMVGEVNFGAALHDAQLKQKINTITTDPTTLPKFVDDLKTDIIGPAGIHNRLISLENIIDDVRRLRHGRLAHFSRRIDSLQRRILILQTKLRADNCRDMPCKNGGSCYDLFDDFFCECPEGWQGRTCEDDFDECVFFAGTDLGCQNDARCINKPGSYSCECTAGWVGMYCTKHWTDCQSSPSLEICGHGTCVPVGNDTGYTCICEQGWTKDNMSMACTVDVNECGRRNPCHSQCINLPGSYMCGPCPPGYTGNGWSCTDINECVTNNGGCSVEPMVRCFNTEGSFRCGVCPPGHAGDGVTCTSFEPNSCFGMPVCHPEADCERLSGTVSCICPHGMVGNGFGPNGCRRETNPCDESLCLNGGTCIANGTSYYCLCPSGYLPPMCIKPLDLCNPNPCENGGTCIAQTRHFICHCPLGFFGSRCGYDSSMCSGMIREQEGFLDFPGHNRTYQPNDECVWVIRTTLGKILHMTFERINIESSKNCENDWLQIHDGREPSAALIGRFCGAEKPKGGTITSTQHYLYLWFRSDDSNSYDGFELRWTTRTPTCGGILRAKNPGIITSPGYPGKTPPGIKCSWTLVAPPGKRIQLMFYSFEAQGKAENCTEEHLTVFEGPTESSSLVLAKYCDSNLPDPLISASREIHLMFETDMSEPDTAFQLHYSTLPGVPDCGGSFSSLSDTLRSPAINGVYPNDLICEYIIELPPRSVITLQFKKFSLVESTSCLEDYVEVYDGTTEEDPFIGRWCGHNRPGNITSSTNTLLVRFRSDFLIGDEGFIARYSMGCRALYNNDTGVIHSPNYPDDYPTNMDCVYKIEAPVGYVVNITSRDFHLESTFPCIYDFIEIYDGHISYQNSRGRFCGSKFPSYMISSLNHVEIHFQTDASDQNPGFYFEYNFIDVRCGGVLKDLNGTISSSNANDILQTALNGTCTWIIDLPQNFSLFIKFSSFYIEDSLPDCKTNYLEVVYNTLRGRQVQRFCGSIAPPPNTYHGLVKLIYKSDFGFTSNGFEASYEGIDAVNQCGGHFSSPAGTIQSPGYPNNYPSLQKCVWIIETSIGHQIELVINKFSLEKDCRFDYLEVRDGVNATSPLIGTYCGDRIPAVLSSFTNALYIQFVSDATQEFEGFDIKFQQTSTGCGGSLNSYRGSIVSPRFQQEVMQCDWKVTINKGSIILINVKYFDYDGDGIQCEDRNYVRIYDGDSAIYRGFNRNCTAGAVEDTFVTSSNTALVRFVSNGSLTGGFHLNYTASCDNEIRFQHGVIESPNYPYDYPNDIECQWKILGKWGTNISVAFTHFKMEESEYENCPNDHVEITEIKNNETIRSGRYCISKPEDFTTEADVVVIKLITDFSIVESGFSLEYRINGCDRTITDQAYRNGFASPGHPAFTRNKDCEYYLSVDYGKIVRLTLYDLSVPAKVNDCSRNGIVIADGYNTSHILAEICQSGIENSEYISLTNKMYVRFRADPTTSGKKFSASFHPQEAKCGGKLKSIDGIIFSPNYPDKYEPNTECIWNIEVAQQHTIDFKFIDLDLVDGSDCIEIAYKNGSKNMVPVYTYCGGNTSPNEKIRTETENAIVTFKAQGNVQGKGFKLQFKQDCGFISRWSGVLFKRAYIDDCVWYLRTEPTRKYRLRFTGVQCSCSLKSNGSSCDNNEGIFVYDGDSTSAPLKVSFCKRHPPEIVTSGPYATILATKGLFTLHYLDHFYGCGGDLRSLHGSVAAPNYPDSYPANRECVWNIKAPLGNSILLHFHTNTTECTATLQIYQGGRDSVHFGTFCENQLPSQIRAYQEVYVRFQSNAIGKGFYLDYSVAHENILTDRTGVLQSPPWDYMHDEDIDYTWRIRVDRSHVITLYIRHYSDGLKVYDGYDDTALEVELDVNSYEVTSTTNYVFLKADHTIPDFFEVVWVAVSRNVSTNDAFETCGHSIISVQDAADLTSPGYPNDYADNLNCEWIIKATKPASRIQLIFKTIDLEETSNCYADYISVSRSSDLVRWENEVKVCKLGGVEPYLGSPYVKINFVSDGSIHQRGFVASLISQCGGSLTQPSGVIQFRGTTDGETECSWTIRVSNNRRIRFQFLQRYNEEQLNGSCRNYLSIRDGYDIDSPFLGIGKYCTNHTDDIPLTTSSRAFVKLVVSEFNLDMKWVLQYHEASEDCGESVQLTRLLPQAVITTPNYPSIPKPYSECIWTVVAPAGESINITIEELSLREKRFCDEESLKIYDGGTALAPELNTYCGTRQNEYISTSRNVAYLKYSSDIPIPSHGFKLVVSLNKCGARHTEEEGTITSENYPVPGAYPRRSVCEYVVDVGSGNINVTFDDIDLPVAENSARSDHLSFGFNIKRSDNSSEYKQILRVNGNGTIRSRLFRGGSLVVRFVTFDINASHRGFKITYSLERRECGAELIGESGEITTPSYPSRPEGTMVCKWLILVPSGRRVKVEFDEFVVDWQSAIVDDSQMATFYFYNDLGSVSEIAAVTREVKGAIYSSSRYMVIKFAHTHGSAFLRAKLHFSSDEATVCSGDPSQSSGEILPPANHNGSYYCDYEFRFTPHETLTFTITDVLIQGNITRCPEDSPIQIFGRNGVDFSVCSSATTLSYSSVLFQRLVIMRNRKLGDATFAIKYARHQCGGSMASLEEMNSISQPILSNGYGKVTCLWVYRRRHEQQAVNLNFTLRLSESCGREYLRVLGAGRSNNFITVCGNADQSLSLSKLQSIEYHSDSYSPYSSFSIDARLRSRCGSNIYMSNGNLELKPEEYTNNADCKWLVLPGDKETFFVKLEFIGSFSIEPSPNCTKDYLEIRNEDNPGTDMLAKLCGIDRPAPIYTRGRRIKLLFRSDNDTVGEGFTIRVTRICSIRFNATTAWQNITHRAQASPGRINCSYTINAPPYKWIHIQFNRVELTNDENCEKESIALTLTTGTNSSESRTFCRLETVRELQSLGQASILFKTTLLRSQSEFEFGFRLSACGGIVTEPTMISSPKVEGQDPGNAYCVWNITAPSDKYIRIEFQDLMIEPSAGCRTDYVRIFAGSQTYSNKRKANLCGHLSDLLPTIRIDESTAIVETKTDATRSHDGFKATVRFVESCDCAYLLTPSNKTFTLEQFDGSYKNNLDCQSTFTTLRGYQLEVNITHLDIKTCNESTPACICDFLEFSDSVNHLGELNGRVCGSQIPPIFTTFSYKLYLRFVTDSSMTGTGFRATITSKPSGCDVSFHRVMMNMPVIIELPPANTSFPPYVKCFWQLQGDPPFDINWERFELPPPSENGECSTYVEMAASDKKHHAELTESRQNEELTTKLISNGETFKFCGTSIPTGLPPRIFQLTLKFVSNSFHEGIGFKFVAKTIADCSENITAPIGRILISSNDSCVINIDNPENYTIALHFRNTDNGVYCPLEFMKIYDKNTHNLTEPICKTLVRSTHLFLNTNRIRIETDPGSSLDITYIASSPGHGVGCGGIFHGMHGTISSPFYTSNAVDSTLCRWDVFGPQRFSIHFLVFLLGSRALCDTNYLQIVEPGVNGRRTTSTFCGEDTVENLVTRGNSFAIIYSKNKDFDGVGWSIYFDQI